jgi:hypothetical protein
LLARSGRHPRNLAPDPTAGRPARPAAAFGLTCKNREACRGAPTVRVNARIDRINGFERHFIRGTKKTRLRPGLALLTMPGTAVARVEMKKTRNIRSLVKAA